MNEFGQMCFAINPFNAFFTQHFQVIVEITTNIHIYSQKMPSQLYYETELSEFTE